MPERRPFPLQDRDGVRREHRGRCAVKHGVQDKREDEAKEAFHPRAVKPSRQLDQILRLGRAAAGVEGQGGLEVVSRFLEAPSFHFRVNFDRGARICSALRGDREGVSRARYLGK